MRMIENLFITLVVVLVFVVVPNLPESTTRHDVPAYSLSTQTQPTTSLPSSGTVDDPLGFGLFPPKPNAAQAKKPQPLYAPFENLSALLTTH